MMQRHCGDCQLCCRLLPVRSPLLDKNAGEKCKHQKFGVGCTVYRTGKMPFECGVWNCRWLVNDDTADLRRPDRSHYVIDIMPDFVTAEGQPFEVVQIWVDPRYPDAHRDPALRAYLERRALEGKVALIRYNARDAFTLVAPSLCDDGQWHEVAGTSSGRTHTHAEIVDTLGDITVVADGDPPMTEHPLGDAPIQEEYRQMMLAISRGLDQFFNGEAKGAARKTGFVLMVYPFGNLADGDARCNYISNGADRRDVVTLMKEMIARFEGQPEISGKA